MDRNEDDIDNKPGKYIYIYTHVCICIAVQTQSVNDKLAQVLVPVLSGVFYILGRALMQALLLVLS